MVLQQVLEDATGRPFAELMRELVLEPLGMSRSGYTQPLPDELHGQAATAHGSDGTPVEGGWHVYPELAAAGLWTTPGDLARFAIGVQQRGCGRSRRAPRAGARRVDAHPPFAGPASRLGGLDSVGLGLFLGGPWFGHSGGNEGFRCHLVAHCDAGCGLAVMTNGDRGHELVAEILDAVARELDWPEWEAVPADEDDSPRIALDVIGAYEVRPGVVIEVAQDSDELQLTLPGQPPIRFLRMSESDFGSFSVETTVAFDGGDLILRQNDGELRCRRVDRYT